jgi:hypothetical protein
MRPTNLCGDDGLQRHARLGDGAQEVRHQDPADLNGKKLGAPVFDAGRRAFPIFAKANNVTGVQWTAMDPPLRETMLVRGDVDAITGFTFTSC